MKRYGIIVLAALIMVACGDNGDKKAEVRLASAQQSFERGDFNEAKLQLDSIRKLYPKAFEVRKKGIKLMQQVELQEQNRTIAYLDSMLKVKQLDVEAKKKNFSFEKNAEYQTYGNYFYPSQIIDKNLHKTYLRAQVNELGIFALTSIYCGRGFIHHRAIKVSLPDGSLAQTPASRDVYETSDLGEKTEKVDYRIGHDGGVASFINQNKAQKIRLEYLGAGKHVITISASDAKAISEVYNFAQSLFGIGQIKKEMKEANLKIRFINKRIELEANEKGKKM